MAVPAVNVSEDMEYMRWLAEIDFYKSELPKMTQQLENILPDFYNASFAAKIEQFQNRFIRQREVIDILRHNIKQHENQIQRLQKNYSADLKNAVTLEHKKLKNDMFVFIDLFVELRSDFNDFIA
ncbi:MAG: hypothetical protein H3C45_11605 [Bacteroidia bacterium]|nr:hypothetical protein [Bacteroidia bacterium]MCC7532913.1 hypothetical protein [Bacteroidia bacterium]